MPEQTISELRQQLAALTAQRDALAAALAECAFVVETVAHLQGHERELLPMADRARALLEGLEKP